MKMVVNKATKPRKRNSKRKTGSHTEYKLLSNLASNAENDQSFKKIVQQKYEREYPIFLRVG